MVAAGIAVFGLVLAGTTPERGWQIFLVNFVFWAGALIAPVAWCAIFELSNARWPVLPRKLAAVCCTALPIVFVLFLATWLGGSALFQHVNTAGLYAREAIGLLALYVIALAFVRSSGEIAGHGTRKLQALAVALLIIYAAAQTLFAWDFLMWLEPHWTSTLFGGFYIVSSLYAGLAMLTLLVLYATSSTIRPADEPQVLRNLGRLLFSFSLLWGYFFWSQYLVIWYGNLPREVGYVLIRTQPPWSSLAAVVLLMNFLLPFLGLMPRSAKRSRAMLAVISGMVLLGVWLQTFLLAMPSLGPGATVLFGWQEALISVGFLALFPLIFLSRLTRTNRLF
jgi:hypothetical protein